MEQFFLIVQMAVVALFTLAPFFCYQKKGKQFVEFYTWMASSAKARRLYRFSFSLLVTMFNYAVADVAPLTYWLMPGMLLAVFLLTDKCTAAIFRRIHDDRRIQGLAFSVFLFCLAVPQLFTLSITIGMTIVAAMFYPSWVLTYYLRNQEKIDEMIRSKNPSLRKEDILAFLYFLSDRAKYDLTSLDQ